MPINTGTHDISTLLAARNQTVAQFGRDEVTRILQEDLRVHNAIVTDMMGELCEVTTDRQRRYGASLGGEMQEVDEYGRGVTQKSQVGETVGFPLKLFVYNIGWTRKFLENATPNDLAVMQQAAQKAHLKAIQRDVKRAMFVSANYTFNDHLVDKVDLSVKRLLNADGAAIAEGPNGETFNGATHTHYSGIAALTSASAKALLSNVIEHGHGNQVRLVISATDEDAFKTAAGADFKPYSDPRLIYRASDTPASTLDITVLNNRAIGLFGAAEVWTKPWGIASYVLAYDSGAEQKPLAFRQRDNSTMQGLRLAAEFDTHPLQANRFEAEFGVGVYNRSAAAVLYTANGTYADPTIN